MKISEVIQQLETYFPIEKAYEWDNCGLQVGNTQNECQKIMIALTLDLNVVNECIDQGANFIITHHPFFFSSLKCIDLNTPIGKIIELLIQHKITVYSSHTCMDVGDMHSMNGWLMETLGIQDYENFDEEKLVKVAHVNETLESLICKVKDKFKLEHIKYVGKLDHPIHKLAIIGGSGSDYISLLASHVDVLITGDLKYHDAQLALEQDLCVIDAGHFIEKVMTDKVKELILPLSIEIVTSSQKDYFNFY